MDSSQPRPQDYSKSGYTQRLKPRLGLANRPSPVEFLMIRWGRCEGVLSWQRTRIRVSVHLIWSTWDRLLLINGDIQERVWASIAGGVRDAGAEVVAVGGVADHVHVLIRLPATVTLAAVVKRAKGRSSRLMNQISDCDAGFRWQRGYAAFSVTPSCEAVVVDYINNQAHHHAEGTTEAELEIANLSD